MRARPRVVFDCMVFLQGAARRASPAGLCLALAEQGLVELCLSAAIVDEVRDVLNRPRVRAKFPALSDVLVDQLLTALLRKATYFDDVPRSIVFARDPKDEPYLNLAHAAQADFLVSRDNDLLSLASGDEAEAAGIREACGTLKILDPVAFLLAVASPMPAGPAGSGTA